MKPDILEVQPHELKFIFELKKQSTCSVQMINKTNHHVAFKIKTTNPKKYCVRPNTGVIDPNSVCDFSVTMQAQKVAPEHMICKDKFLVQSAIVPEGTKEEDITSNTFAKEDGKVVDEKRLKVILVSPPDSPEPSPVKETPNLVQSIEGGELEDDVAKKHSSSAKVEESMQVPKGDGKSVEVTRNEEPVRKTEEAVKRNGDFVKESKEYIKRNEEVIQMSDAEELKLVKDVEETKAKVKELEAKLNEAKATILLLTEEKRSATQEKHFLQGELDLVRSKRYRAQVGFPLLFVFMVALVSLYLGYLLHH